MEAIYRQQSEEIRHIRYSCVRQFGSSATSLHWHDCSEIIYMERGSLRLFFNGSWMPLGEGEMIFVPPGRIHCTVCTDENAVKLVIGFENALVSLSESSRNINRYQMPFYLNEIDKHCLFNRNDAKRLSAEHLLRELEECVAGEPSGHELYAHGLILMMYARIYRYWEEEKNIIPKEIGIPLIWEVLQIIHENYASSLSPYEIAARFHISYSHLNKLFQQTLHMGFKAYVISVKLHEAEKLLLSTDLSVSEIASRVGYDDFSYFIRQFRKTYAVPPHQYRTYLKKRLQP